MSTKFFSIAGLACLFLGPVLQANSLDSGIQHLNNFPGTDDIRVNFTASVVGMADDEDLLVDSNGTLVVLDMDGRSPAGFPAGTLLTVDGELERSAEWSSLGTTWEVDVFSLFADDAGVDPGDPVTPPPASSNLADAINAMTQNPGWDDLMVNFTASVVGMADDEDLLVDSNGILLVLDLGYASAAIYPTGTTLQLSGELERAPRWEALGTSWEVDVYSISVEGQGDPGELPVRPSFPSLDLTEAMNALTQNPAWDDLQVRFQAEVVGMADDEDLLVQAGEQLVVLDWDDAGLPALSNGALLEIHGELERAPEWQALGTVWEVDAFLLTLVTPGAGDSDVDRREPILESGAALSLPEGIDLLQENPQRDDVTVQFQASITGMADDEDLLVESGGIVLVLDFDGYQSTSLNVGSVVTIEGELERAPEWQSLGTTWEVDVFTAVQALEQLSVVPEVINLSTRGEVGTGDNVMIAGFVVEGDQPRQILVRALGPSLSLPPYGLDQVLADPVIQLYEGSDILASNDNWADGRIDPTLLYSPLRPASSREAVILKTLSPGAYTAIVQGANLQSGLAIVEVYDFEDANNFHLINVSTRGKIMQGAQQMIGGFVIQGQQDQTVLITARGPSLGEAPFNLENTMVNPEISLYRGGERIAFNTDWEESTGAAFATEQGVAPSNGLEALLKETLSPGAYTVMVRCETGGDGIGILEIMAVEE